MIKYWQPMQDYKYFLNESKVHFDSSERVRLHTELWKPWQKLRLFDTDKAMEFTSALYLNTGRPAKNQPQILRSFTFFFLFKGNKFYWGRNMTPSCLNIRIPFLYWDFFCCRPSGSYFDFMDRL